MGRSHQLARAEAAWQTYLGLGPGRSLQKLVRHYAKTEPGKPLSISTAKVWCKKFRWVQKAEEHDADIAAQVQAQATKAQVTERVSGAVLSSRRFQTSRKNPRPLSKPGVTTRRCAPSLDWWWCRGDGRLVTHVGKARSGSGSGGKSPGHAASGRYPRGRLRSEGFLG